MMAVPAWALELGQLNVESGLGQPLRASIAYALNPNERLYDFCVYLRPGISASGLPVLSKASVSVADGMILLSGKGIIREPLLTMQVSIDCPYTAQLSRDYTLMLDPPQSLGAAPAVAGSPAMAAPVAATAPVASPSQKPQRAAEPRRTAAGPPIAEGSRHLVRRGETLSEIAARISHRSIPLWPAVDRIFAANPDAFLDGDQNRLKAGSWLDIPDLSAAASQTTVSGPAATTDSSPAPATAEASVYAGYQAPVVSETVSEAETAAAEAAAGQTGTAETAEPEVAETTAAIPDFADLRPGDVVLESDNPFVSPVGPADESGSADAVGVPQPQIVRPAAVVKTGPGSVNDSVGRGSWSWFIWLGGTGLALILGLLLFGQKIRQRFGSVAVGAAPMPSPNRRRTDSDTQRSRALTDVDFDVTESPASAHAFTLDADFDDGTGLQDSSEMDVAQDFGFSASSTFAEELDMVLPEVSDDEERSSPTDIIPPPPNEDEAPILEREVLPSDDEDAGDYDLSMIVDATKQAVVESDATAKDLQAVQIESGAQADAEDYTLSQEVDYKILEQDYEDEFTATQALNAEIAKAAAELAERMEGDSTGEITTSLPKNMRAENDDVNDLDDTGINDEVTAKLPDVNDEVTAEMPKSEDDVTLDMEIESGTIDTKKKKKAS